jgi:flagellar biosynthesis/type III secretory pathway protein FliH
MPSEEYIRDLESNRIFHSYGYDEGYKDGYKKGYEDGKKASSDGKEAEG